MTGPAMSGSFQLPEFALDYDSHLNLNVAVTLS